jgi:hypothetical protein
MKLNRKAKHVGFSLWEHMTATEQLLFDAARRRRDREAANEYWMAALMRLATDAVDSPLRAEVRSWLTPEARRRFGWES